MRLQVCLGTTVDGRIRFRAKSLMLELTALPYHLLESVLMEVHYARAIRSMRTNYPMELSSSDVLYVLPSQSPLIVAWKVAPALACGNTVVLKTAEQTPLSALYLCTLIQKAGFPPGAVNVISGFGKITGTAIVQHPGIDKIAFTGSTAIGKEIARTAGLKKVTLELGGKSPNIVFEDADIEQAVKWSHNGMFYNMGQVCSATTRIYVQESIKDKFIKAFAEYTKSNKVGNPFDEDTYQGPQISQRQFERITEYIKVGKQEGAKLIMGEEPKSPDNGYFIQPHIFAEVKPDMRVSLHQSEANSDCSRGNLWPRMLYYHVQG